MFSCLNRLVATCVCLIAAAPATADECDQLAPPSVTLRKLPATLSVNTRYGYREITHLAAEIARPGTRVLGLTRGTAKVRMEVRSPSHVDRSKRWECTSPQIVVTYGFDPMTVYIAREFPERGCAYNEIYAHEMKHVKTYHDHLTAIEGELTEALRYRFATGTPWRGPVGYTRTILQRELNDRWLPYIKREIGKVEAAQALIDTADEYERVARSCNGDIQKRLK
ncbi:MAG: hypothetical protein QM739_05780 [Propionivibrio sp.]